MTTENIVQFQEVLCMTPRYGIFDIQSREDVILTFELNPVVATISTCTKISFAFVAKHTITKSCTRTLQNCFCFLNQTISMSCSWYVVVQQLKLAIST